MGVVYEKVTESACGGFRSAGNELWSNHHTGADRHPGGRSAERYADRNPYATPHLYLDAHDPGADFHTYNDPDTRSVHGETG
jgi:hypothetical protein